MTLVLRKQRAEDRIEGGNRHPIGATMTTP
jgi:hypothetical protein